MKPETREAFGQFIDTLYREQTLGIDIHKAVVDFFEERDSHERMALKTFYHDDWDCVFHGKHFELAVGWDGLVVGFVLSVQHRQFTAEVEYRLSGGRVPEFTVHDFQGSEDALAVWLDSQGARLPEPA